MTKVFAYAPSGLVNALIFNVAVNEGIGGFCGETVAGVYEGGDADVALINCAAFQS